MKWTPHYTGIETLEIPLLPGDRADLYLSRQRNTKRLDLVRLSVRPWRYTKMVGMLRHYDGVSLFASFGPGFWDLKWLAKPARRVCVEWDYGRQPPRWTLTWWRLALTTPIAPWVASWRRRVDEERWCAQVEAYQAYCLANGIALDDGQDEEEPR